jgi:hypothetical protein
MIIKCLLGIIAILLLAMVVEGHSGLPAPSYLISHGLHSDAVLSN